jgi:hypothetical protein
LVPPVIEVSFDLSLEVQVKLFIVIEVLKDSKKFGKFITFPATVIEVLDLVHHLNKLAHNV